MTDRCMGFLTFKERMFRSLGSLKIGPRPNVPTQFVQVMGTLDTKNEIELRRIGTSKHRKESFYWDFRSQI
jgi:hypothetical protein